MSKSLPNPTPGLVVRYAYIWMDEYLQGLEEGLKDRPCAIVAAIQDKAGLQRVLCLPITHSLPTRAECAVEIPLPVKRHLKLDDARSWIVVNESNEFVWPGPDLRPVDLSGESSFVHGFLPPALFNRVRNLFLALTESRQTRPVPRSQ